MIERRPLVVRMITSSLLYLLIMIFFTFSSLNYDTLRIIAIIMVTVLYVFYFTHALINTIKYIRKVPGITLTKELLTVYTTLSKKEISVSSMRNVELLEYKGKYLNGLKMIDLEYVKNNKLKKIRITDLYKTSILPLYEILLGLIK